MVLHKTFELIYLVIFRAAANLPDVLRHIRVCKRNCFAFSWAGGVVLMCVAIGYSHRGAVVVVVVGGAGSSH